MHISKEGDPYLRSLLGAGGAPPSRPLGESTATCADGA